MCEPATLTALATFAAEAAPYVAAATAVAGYAQQQQQADKQEASVRQGYAANLNQLQVQQTQINQQATDKASAASLEALRETGRLRAIGGDAGALGASFDRQTNEVEMNTGQNIAAIEANRVSAESQATAEGMAAQARATMQLNSIKQPSLIGTGLQIAGAGVDASRRGQQNRVAQ